MRDVVIVGAARTPIGAFQGALQGLSAPALGGVAIAEAVRRAGFSLHERPEGSGGSDDRKAAPGVDEVYMGCVLTAGLGQAPARQAALGSGLPESVGTQTVNKVCGSGLKAVTLAAASIALGDTRTAVAGGMESMSGAPYLLPQARAGQRLGHGKVLDSVIHDGLWDPRGDAHMGAYAELCARSFNIDRAAQDAHAIESYARACRAQELGLFDWEMAPVSVPQRKGEAVRVVRDEEPERAKPEKIASLRPAFEIDGTVTAGNASSLNDGAAALVLMGEATAAAQGLEPLARICGWSGHAQAPERFTTAPAGAVQKLLDRLGWASESVDLWEINEAFSVVALANMHLLGLDPERVNIWGGAVALGHPLGASGARILVTLLSALAHKKAKRGIAALCIGGGEGIAIGVERL